MLTVKNKFPRTHLKMENYWWKVFQDRRRSPNYTISTNYAASNR